jgi:hypothetical protein
MTSYFLLSLLPDFRTALPELLGITALIILMLYVIIYAGEQGAISWSPRLIILVAASVRLMFLFRPAELSDDIYRYLWDGLQLLDGHNPYTYAPSSVHSQDAFLAELRQRVNHPDLVTIYPPAAQLIFIAGAAVHKSIFGIKALLIVLDLATCFVMTRLLRSMRLPAWRTVLYAWNPLVVVETAASGHIDTAGLMFFLISLLLLVKNNIDAGILSKEERSLPVMRPWLIPLVSGLLFSSAVLVKLVPLIFLPGLILLAKKRGRLFFVTGFVAGVCIFSVPFIPDLRHMFNTLSIYAQNWEFSGLAFRSLRNIVSSGSVARVVLLSVFTVICLFLYSRLISKSRLPTEMKNRGLASTLYIVSFSFLTCTPTLHPWYVLYLAAFLPFTVGVAGLALSWSIFLAYHVLIPYFYLGRWIENDYIPVLVWFVPLSVYLLTGAGRSLFSGPTKPPLR